MCKLLRLKSPKARVQVGLVERLFTLNFLTDFELPESWCDQV